MSKRYSVNETWELCLAKWKWISRQCKSKSEKWCVKNVGSLKERWLTTNGFTVGDMENSCFFCEYDALRQDSCMTCPAREIENTFHCISPENYYLARPRKFYAELKRLNKIRLTCLEQK